MKTVRRDIARIYNSSRVSGSWATAPPRASRSEPDAEPTARNERKVRRGYVSDKMDKTVVVQIEDRAKHALYGKVMRKNKKAKVHDEHNECGVGDLVLIMETRPPSATCAGALWRSSKRRSDLRSQTEIRSARHQRYNSGRELARDDRSQ